MSQKDRGKGNRKQITTYEEDSHHHFKINKKRQQQKTMRTLERALKSKDYGKLMNADDIY